MDFAPPPLGNGYGVVPHRDQGIVIETDVILPDANEGGIMERLGLSDCPPDIGVVGALHVFHNVTGLQVLGIFYGHGISPKNGVRQK